MSIYDITTTPSFVLKEGDSIICPCSDSMKTTILPMGNYLLECWGACGNKKKPDGNTVNGTSGKGGYSKGIIKLLKDTQVFLYAGGWPFNGGGTTTNYGGTGGGGTDIRLREDKLSNRVIVAGGGGGSGWTATHGGFGGGENGGDGSGGTYSSGKGGKQDSGAAFGMGDNADTTGGGGGGGWYGGFGGQSGSKDSAGGGGSGYIHTDKTKSSLSTLTEEDYLSEAVTYSGDKSFHSPAGVDETGHDDSGYIRITRLENPTYMYYKIDDFTWKILV